MTGLGSEVAETGRTRTGDVHGKDCRDDGGVKRDDQRG